MPIPRNSDSHPPIPDQVDVAFSLLAGDSAIAEELEAILRPRFRVFVWKEQQRDLAGKNGVATFTELYERRAQLVVVLYREGYGQTKWTRIEETAITSRILERGSRSVFVVSLDGTKPSWLSGADLYLGWESYGAKVAAEAIGNRFQDIGATPHPETVLDRAARAEEERQGYEHARIWRSSMQGVEGSRDEFRQLAQYLAQRVDEIAVKAPSFEVRFSREGHGSEYLLVQAKYASFSVALDNPIANHVLAAALIVEESEMRRQRGLPYWENEQIGGAAFAPCLDWQSDAVVWKRRSDPHSREEPRRPGQRSTELVDFYLDRLIQRSSRLLNRG